MDMKKEVKFKVKEFMDIGGTGRMSSNEFIRRYMYYDNGCIGVNASMFLNIFKDGPSVESILRSRRYWISKNPEKYGRTQADSEEIYKEEFVNDGLISKY